MLVDISVDEILLLGSGNWSTNFRDLPLEVEIVPSGLSSINSILFVFPLKPMALIAYPDLRSTDSTWAGVFRRSAR